MNLTYADVKFGFSNDEQALIVLLNKFIAEFSRLKEQYPQYIMHIERYLKIQANTMIFILYGNIKY
jgi:uncharacterized protein YsxB (DUF464 family)